MRIAIGVSGEPLAPTSPREMVQEARRAEADGFPSAWSAHFSRGVHALSVLAVAGRQTNR
jgi:5,10-methylenetetrahydromethanopterin reductase